MKSSDIYDNTLPEEFEEIEFIGMDFSDMQETDPSTLIHLPVQAEISPDAQVGLLSNSFVVKKGTWREVSEFLVNNWERLNGVYSIVDQIGGQTIHEFTVAR